MMFDIEEALEQAESSAPRRNCKIVKKGILSKKSRSKYISGPWTLRTVVLDSDNRLSYYDGKVLKGEVLLAGTMVNHVTQDVADGKTFPFQISNISLVKRSQTSSLLLAAGSFQEADDWVTRLSKAAVGSTSTGAAGYITFEEVVTNSAVPAKAVDARDLKEKRMRTKTEKTSSKDNLLKYGDVADDDSSGDDEG